MNPLPRIQVLFAHLGIQWPEALLQKHLPSLSPRLQADVLRYHKWQDRQRSLIGKLLLLAALEREGMPLPGTLELEKTAEGKPFLPQGPAFNISHSGELVVLACSREIPVGIDTEEIRPIKAEEYELFFSKAEFEAMADPGSDKRFFQFWTAKEAVAKADGRGLTLDLKHFSTNLKNSKGLPEKWNLQELELIENHVTYLATPTTRFELQVDRVEFLPSNPSSLHLTQLTF